MGDFGENWEEFRRRIWRGESPNRQIELDFDDYSADDDFQTQQNQQTQQRPYQDEQTRGRVFMEYQKFMLELNQSDAVPEVVFNDREDITQIGYVDPNQECFAFSGFNAVELQRMDQIIAKLGGRTTKKATFDPRATHYIAKSLKSSIKTMSYIVAKRWVLCDQYITDSQNGRKFLKVRLLNE